MMSGLRLSGALVLSMTAAGCNLAAQGGLDDSRVRARYTKREVQIPMRDGVKLFTSIYLPKNTTRSYAIMLTRGPFGVAPYGPDAFRAELGPSPLFEEDGYIFAYQDVRGRYMSEGTFEDVRPIRGEYHGPEDTDESTDAYDTIEWLVNNLPDNYQMVGMWGIGSSGGYAEAGLIRSHRSLMAVSLQAPVSDRGRGDDWHDNGTFRLAHAFGFIPGFDWPRPAPVMSYPPQMTFPTRDGYKFYLESRSVANLDAKYLHGRHPYWNELLKHPDYDAFWKARNLLPHLRDVKPAVLTTGGWFDSQNLYGALQAYKHIERQSPATRNSMVFGPWSHGGWSRGDGDVLGDIAFGSKTAAFYRENIEYPFFAYYLKELGPPPPEAYVFQTGSNTWQQFDAWPPKGATPGALYLHAGGKIRFEPPRAGAAYDEYVSDPAKPVPYTREMAIEMTSAYAAEDQRFVQHRPDVLVYKSDALDHDMSIVGPLNASLWVSTSGTDSDWVVKLIDVYPDNTPDPAPNPQRVTMGGYEQLVRANAMRARFRTSFEQPRPMIPGEPAKLDFELNDINHAFRARHRIMVQIQSTWFPIVDRNTQTFVPNIELAKDSDFRKATQRLYHTPSMPSHINILVTR